MKQLNQTDENILKVSAFTEH